MAELSENPESRIGPFLAPERKKPLRPGTEREKLFSLGTIRMETDQIHTVRPLTAAFPKGRLSVVTGVSGSGKTTMILESLIPAMEAAIAGKKLPPHVKSLEAPGISQVKLIDATPIGLNVRSTVATYANVHDELRKVYAKTKDAKERGLKAGDFSYNTGSLRCPTCDGTGQISVSFLRFIVSCIEKKCVPLHQKRMSNE